MCWVPGQAAGILVAGGHGAGTNSIHLSYPSDVIPAVLCPWSPDVHNATGSSSRALVKLMLTIDVSRVKRGLVALGSTLMIAVMSWALPLQRQCRVSAPSFSMLCLVEGRFLIDDQFLMLL